MRKLEITDFDTWGARNKMASDKCITYSGRKTLYFVCYINGGGYILEYGKFNKEAFGLNLERAIERYNEV